jgi:hypothetical protein
MAGISAKSPRISLALRENARIAIQAFTINPEAREAINFYVWDSEEAAKAFFNEELVRTVTGVYGVRPSIAFVEIARLVESAAILEGVFRPVLQPILLQL